MSDLLTTRHKLKLWEALALSLGLMGPTLAMALNGVGVAGLVGKSVPLVFLLGAVGVGLVAYGFIRLTRHFNHAGSVYALAGATIGPRAGFFGGFALLGTYLFFTMSTLSAAAVFTQAFVVALGVAWVLPWVVVSLATAVLIAVLNSRESRVTARTLLVIEAVGITSMLVLAVVIVARTATTGGPQGQQLDLSVFSLEGVGMGPLLTATVFAFLSWAGFEACASLGEETDNPRRNIPGALIGSLVLTCLLYVIVMSAQSIGFGTSAAGIDAFASSESSLVDLGRAYIGVAFALVISFCALTSALGSAMSSATAASRLLFALARDGFGPRALARTNAQGAPSVAAYVALVLPLVVCAVLWLTGAKPFDAYYWTATLGVLCLLLVYAVAAGGVIVFTVRGQANIPKWELVIPTLGIAYLCFVFYKQSVGQVPPFDKLPYIAGAWCLIGLVVAVAAPGLARRIGSRLTEELAGVDAKR